MKNIALKKNVKFFFILFLILNFSYHQRIYPDNFRERDFIYDDNDRLQNYEYSLIEAKVLTKEEITLYLKKQGIHLTYDYCCRDLTDIDVWDKLKDKSDYEEVYRHAKYNTNGGDIEYDFPVQKIENRGYTVNHKLWIVNPRFSGPRELTIKINFSNNNILPFKVNPMVGEIAFISIKIIAKSNDINEYDNYIEIRNLESNPQLIVANQILEGKISKITFSYEGNAYSPAIALHWTYYKVIIANSNFSLKGNSLCDKVTNPCISGYYCIGGVCKKCHPSCFDCVNGGLSTDCYSKCSSHSGLMTPNKGTCNIGYVDLNQFDDFDIEDIIPPPRNNRLTISFWMYLNHFPEKEVEASIINSFHKNIYLYLDFSDDNLIIKCANRETKKISNIENTWIFIKCAISFDHEDGNREYLYFKYYDKNSQNYDIESYYDDSAIKSENRTNCLHDFKKYYEPDDYISMHFYKFNQLSHPEYTCNVFMKELVLYREFLPEPYDNKYFSIEKLLTSTLELPEVLFVIPFDELKKEGNKYKVKCYSYPENIEENEIILSPKESGDFTLYPPKLFKRLNLLEKNKKYASTDLLQIIDIPITDSQKILMASYDNIPLSCIDNNFLSYDISTLDPTTYKGTCDNNCPNGSSMIFGLGDRKGFCNYKCNVSPHENSKCMINGGDLLSYKDKFECVNSFYNIFYKCESESLEEQRKNIFYYDPNYLPANIVIDVRTYNLNSYIIEFWYYFSDCVKITSGYIFYSNQIQVQKIEGSYNIYTTAHGVLETTIDTIVENQWNQIVFEVYYDPREERNYKTRVYLQTNLNTGNAQEIDFSENPYPLEYIYFCNGRRASCNNLELNWFCGYYRNLRLFNGELSQRHVTYRYDEYYEEYPVLLSSIVLYFPLYGNYISNNILRQYRDKLNYETVTSPTNTWNYPQYNYCIRPDNNCGLIGDSIGDCLYCFNKDQCYKCNSRMYITKEKGGIRNICKSEEDTSKKFVLKLPMDNDEFEINHFKDDISNNYHGVTVNFFIKLFGFKVKDKIDIIHLSDNLKLSYNSNFNELYFGLNLVSHIGTSETIISNYYDFRKHFGVWTFISVATYNKTNDNFFPAMVRFEINNKKMPIILTSSQLDNLYINKITFSNQIFALIQRIKVYKTYIIGALAFETHDKSMVQQVKTNIYSYAPSPDEEGYFKSVETSVDCKISEKIRKTKGIGDNYQCVPDDDEQLINFNVGDKNEFLSYYNESRTLKSDCDSSCDICIGNSKYNCSCNFDNNNEKIFLGNLSDHFCKQLDFINFATLNKNGIATTLTEKANDGQFTLHFWVFAYSYIENVFKGLEVEWEGHTTVQVILDSTKKYYFNCLINGRPVNKTLDFYMNKWNFLHCAVDYINNKVFMTTEEESYKMNYTGSFTPGTKLIIRDLTEQEDWGVLFYKHIRLWKDAFQYSSFLSRIEIINNYFPSGILLYQFNTKFNKNHKACDSYKLTPCIVVTYVDEYKIGTNIVPEEIYNVMVEEPILCDENGQYYDRKTLKCVKFEDISNVKTDIEIEDVDVAYSHNYAMAFWILLEDHTDIIKPINFDWEYHMKISLQYVDGKFKAYCFPQNYYPYSKIIADVNLSLDEKTDQVLNSITNTYDEDLGGQWTWFQCSLSYNNRLFYLNENQKTLIAETLYKEENLTEYKNDEPLGYFYNSIKYDSKSKLTIEQIANRDRPNNGHKKIYLRCFYLFKDYLPFNYNYKYMDMYKIDKEQFPPLTLAINFALFTVDDKDNPPKLSFEVRKYTSLENLIYPTSLVLEIEDPNDKELAANFIFLPLCNPLENEKYDSTKQLCQEIYDCDKVLLNALYCMEEKTPLICKTNYYINIDSTKDDAVECLNYCKGRYYRSPGTLPTQGICGTDCFSVDILKTCPNTAASILNYQNDFACLTGLTRIGYQCFNNLEAKNKGALFYSGINYPYNIYQSFTNDFLSLIGSGYVLEFWFMIDNVIYNNTNFKTDVKYHYFNAKPHEIYVENHKYYYLFNSGDGPLYYKQELTGLIHQYEWNKIVIFADATISGVKEVRVYVNFDKIPKKIEVTKGELTLTYISFCSNAPDLELNYPECVVSGNKINWASAYYNNIRIWNIWTSTVDTIQSFINGIYSEYPQSILLFYPLTIEYLDNNVMTNIMGNLQEHISFKCVSGARCTLYNKDNIIIYNYSSKFDWGLLHENQFVFNMDGDFTMIVHPRNCSLHCIRCFEEDNINNCYECEEGYVLKFKECKKAQEFYFLKTPSGSVDTPYNLAIENKDGNEFTSLTGFTIVFWMKFFGVKYPTVTEYCRILTLDPNTYLAFHRTTNNLVVLENSKIVFRDTNFQHYFGIWIPISIANYVSNAKSEIYPNMFTLSVNKIDIPFSEGYSIPSTGIKVTQLQLGYEIIALFAELSIYSKFIQGGYGRIRSNIYEQDLYYNKSLIGNSSTNCIDVSTDLLSAATVICAPDYNINFMKEYYCEDDKKYYNPYDSNNDEKTTYNDRCQECDSLCNTLCFLGGSEECTCDMTEGKFWLRRNVQFQTYCEHIPYLDFGNLKPYTYTNAPMSKTKEYTIEFWFFVYSYNTVTMNFKTLWIEWNYHNRLKLYNEQNGLKVDCQPLWHSGEFDTVLFPDTKSSALKYYQWNYVKCGTDLKNKKYFLNTITEYALKAKEEYYWDLKQIDITATEEEKYFSIYRSSDFLMNFGYIFIRELKLWQQYNRDFIDIKNIYFNMETRTTVENLKYDFPGLLLYYINDFKLDGNDNPLVIEILTNNSQVIGRDPDYVGYNIVDPERKGYAPLLVICEYGQLYNDLLLHKCQCPDGTILNDPPNEHCEPELNDDLCEIYSNLEKQCLKCPQGLFLNKWLDEFEEKCYEECPPTTYGDRLMNQCRRCHETCYTCTNDLYNNCLSCTGELYFNDNEKTCIPNCQAAGLTRSLTKPNLCVVFDADASLVNVNTLTPIDIHTFDYIEAIVIQPTSPEYKTLWLFDAEQTNIVNRELGFDDDIALTATPFTGKLNELRAELDHEFFKAKHKYVFGLKIYVEKEGLEVPIYVWWTLTMNSPPYGGKVTVMPYLGLYNTTTFIMRCVDFEDENTPTEDLEYDFYYIEANTNSKIKLSKDFSLNNEVYSNFTVRYYQLEYSNVTIYCQVRDKFGDIEEASAVITIVNQKDSPLYVLKQIVESFYVTSDPLTDIQLLARAEVLMSLGIRPYTDRMPSLYFTTYSGSITGEKVEKKDPYCVTGYCSDHGDCEVIDVALTCKCVSNYIGKECFLDKDGYTELAYNYKTLYTRLIDRLILGNTINEPINEIVFTAFYRLFFAAQNFFQEDSFFETNLRELKTYLKEEIDYIIENEDRVNKLFDLNEFYYTYFYIKETQLKLKNKIENNYPFRNKTLELAEYLSYQTSFQTLFEQIDDDTVFLIKNYKKDYVYTSQHFIYHLKKIDETFNEESYFESLKTVYVTYIPKIYFMDCLKEKNPTFTYYFSYIEYLVNPLSYEGIYYPNITSPLISIKIYDINGHEIPIRNCPSTTPIKIHLPFHSYDWMNYINEQKWLFLPENYKLENDPIFRDPIYICDNGSVSDDTVDQRIAKYYRYYNIVGLVYTPTSLSLYEYSSFLFKNISDAFLLMFQTNHLSSFSSMIIPNIMNFVVDGRFYYLPRYKVLFYFGNHIDNGAFYIWASLLFLFISISIFYYFYDYTYFDNIEQLEFLQKEIVKVHFPYGQLKPGLNDENIYNLIPKESKLQKKKMKGIKNMFRDYDMDDKKENQNEESDENVDDFSLNQKITEKLKRLDTNNEKPSSRRDLKSKEEEEDDKDKVTEIRTHKRNKSYKNHKKIKKNDDKYNPPRRNYDNDDREKEPEKTILNRRKESYRNNNAIPGLNNIDKTFSKSIRSKSERKGTERSKIEMKLEEEKGYGDDKEDFKEKNIIEDFIKSEKDTINTFTKSNRNFDMKTLDSKGFGSSKLTKGSRRSKKSYFYDKDKILANYISLQRFHNRAGRTNVDNDGIPLDIINEEQERKKALESFTRLSLTPLAFFKYNVKARHILIAPFLNLSLFNNRWKKLMVLLTQFYIQQLVISLILTYNSTIDTSNLFGIIITSLIASITSDILVYCFVFLFETSTYQRKRLYRLVMMGERLYVIKAWARLKRTMNFSFFFGFLIAMGFWGANCYISLIFTAVWKMQRSTWIICFILTLFFDLVGGELLTEGICAYFYNKRVNSEFSRKLGEGLNRLRCYRTLWP